MLDSLLKIIELLVYERTSRQKFLLKNSMIAANMHSWKAEMCVSLRRRLETAIFYFFTKRAQKTAV